MIEAIISMFTDSLAPKSVIKWFRRRISYKSRIARSTSISYEEFISNLTDKPQIETLINATCSEYKATTILLTAYPVIDEKRHWQCIGIDENSRFLFELKIDLSGAKCVCLDEDQVYHVAINRN